MRRNSKPSGVPKVQYLDANVFIFARVDTGNKGVAARKLLEKIENGQLSAATCVLTADEVIWAVRRELKSYEKAIEWCERILVLPIKVLAVNYADINQALNYMKSGKKPRDSIHAAVAINNGIKEIISDDPDFENIKGLKLKSLV